MIINQRTKGGAVGKDGVTPHIGSNGNWFLGTEDTGVIAKAQSNTTIVSITLLASNWSTDNNTQTIICTGISADESSQNINISPALKDQDKYMNAGISCTGFAEDSLTFTADTIPTEDILVYVAIEETGGATSNDVYSTEETVVGTWIDGRPIYRKTFIVTATGNSSSVASTVITTEFTITDIHLVDSNVICRDPIHNHEIAGYTGWSASLNNIARWSTMLLNSKGLSIHIRDVEQHENTVYINISYIKLADIPTIEIPSTAALNEAYEEGVNEA